MKCHRSNRPLALLAVAVTAPAWGAAAPADVPTSQPADAADVMTEVEPPPAPESVDRQLQEAKSRPAGILKYGPVSIIDPAWKALNRATDDIGLNVGLAYTAVFQAASEGPGKREAAGGDIDLFGDWRLLGEKGGANNGYLYFAAENRHDLGTGIAPAALGGQIDSLWGTTNGFGEQHLTVKELYWQQHFGTDRLILRLGKLDAENYYNSNYWQSDSKYFMNQAFSSFPVRAFPSNGLGLNATTKLSDEWYVSAGFQDAQGKKTEAGFDTFFNDFNLFGAAEVGFIPTIEGVGRGTYRFTGWYRDAGERNGKPHDSGFDVSFDQRVGPHLIPFFRAGVGDANVNGIETMISAGVGWEGELITKSDVVGLAVAWGSPAGHDLDDQYAAELFYRLQVSPDNQLTVGYQLILSPSFDPGHDSVGVFELRWRITL